jgi:hypothetical protein
MRNALALTLAMLVTGAVVGLTAHARPRPERPITNPLATVDAGPVVAVEIPPAWRRGSVAFEIRGPDFSDARERSCYVEARLEVADGGEPMLLFRCAAYGGP